MAEDNKLEFPIVLVKESCIICGIKYAIPEYYLDQRKKDHKNFHCPNGHSQHYPGRSDLDRIKDLEADVERLKNVLRLIAASEVSTVFNKNQLETAIELAKGALK